MSDQVSEMNQSKKGLRPWAKGLIAVVALLIVAFLSLVLSNSLLIFKNGIYFSNAESIALPVTESEVQKLEKFKALKEADLTGSECYKQIYEWASAHPEIAVHYGVGLPEGASYDEAAKVADLSAFGREEALAIAGEHAKYIRDLDTVKLDLSKWTADELEAFHKDYPGWDVVGVLTLDNEKAAEFSRLIQEYPDVEFKGTVDIAGSPVTIGAEKAEISEPSQEAFSQLNMVMTHLPGLKTVDFGTDLEGYSKLPEVYAFQKDHPDFTVDYRFSFFDKIVSMNAEKLDLHQRKMTDQGAAVREVIACMPKLTWLDMDTCNVDNEHMAAIRDDFPDIKVVWRVWLGKVYSVRTDVEKILASAPETAGSLTPATAEPLKYCTDVKYLDIGHNEKLKYIDFVQYMPKLEVFIVMWGDVHDISPIKNCTHLEFFEIFTSWITDLSPLSEMHELKHLNICHNPRLKDLSPIFGLTQLERLWIGNHTGIPKSQIEEFRKLAPNCRVNDTVGDAHSGWRGDEPRYQLLRKQMGYNYPDGPTDYQFYWRDPLYKAHDDLDLEWNMLRTTYLEKTGNN